jgi:predicted DNA-binding mobile mystery protein A
MSPPKRDPRALAALDRRMASDEVRAAARALRPPRDGWIRAVRRALGMSGRQLGERLGVSGAAISQMEASERAGTVSLGKLTAVADALDCDLVYALVPRRSLDAAVEERARQKAAASVAATSWHMALEAQAVEPDAASRVIDELTERWRRSPRLWDGDAPPVP